MELLFGGVFVVTAVLTARLAAMTVSKTTTGYTVCEQLVKVRS